MATGTDGSAKTIQIGDNRPGGVSFTLRATADWDFVHVDMNGQIEPRVLIEHGLNTHLRPDRPVVFFGKGTVWLYGHLVGLVPGAPWVACGTPMAGAIVVRSSDARMPLGKVIPVDDLLPLIAPPSTAPSAPGSAPAPAAAPASPNRVIAVVGPPHSGKSVFNSALERALQAQLAPSMLARDVYFASAAPDGEGKWSHLIAPDLAARLRRKGRFDMEFVNSVANGLVELRKTKRLTLVDLGGRIDEKQAPILAACTHVLIVSRDPAASQEWRGAAALAGLPIVGEVRSVLTEASEVVSLDPLCVQVGPLVRGQEPPRLPAALVDAIAGDMAGR